MAFPTASSATTTTFSTSVTSMSVNLPASISSGDLIIAVSSVRNAGSWTLPSDWNEIASQSSGGVGELTVFYKIADGTEGSTATFTASTGTTGVWQTRKITGWHGTSPPEVLTSSSGGIPGTEPNPPGVIATWGGADNLWIAVGGAAAASVTITSYPTDYTDGKWTNFSSGGSSSSVGTAIRQLNASGEDPSAFDTSTSRWWYAATIVIRPAASVSSPRRLFIVS